MEENNILEGIKEIKNCPGILGYYGMKELQIEFNKFDFKLVF